MVDGWKEARKEGRKEGRKQALFHIKCMTTTKRLATKLLFLLATTLIKCEVR